MTPLNSLLKSERLISPQLTDLFPHPRDPTTGRVWTHDPYWLGVSKDLQVVNQGMRPTTFSRRRGPIHEAWVLPLDIA